MLSEMSARYLHQRQTLGFCTFIQAWSIKRWARVTDFVNLKSQCFFFLHLVLQAKTTKPKKILLLPCMYRYAFSFALKLTTILLQKLATFHMRNVKKG